MKSKNFKYTALIIFTIIFVGIIISIIAKVAHTKKADSYNKASITLYHLYSDDILKYELKSCDAKKQSMPVSDENGYGIIDNPNIRRFTNLLNSIEVIKSKQKTFRTADTAIEILGHTDFNNKIESLRIIRDYKNRFYIQSFGKNPGFWLVTQNKEACEYFFTFYEDFLQNGEIIIGNKKDKDGNPNGSYLVSGNNEILTPAEVPEIQIGFGNPSAKAHFDAKEESECAFIKDKNVINQILNTFDMFYATEIAIPRHIKFDKSVELLVYSNNYKEHNAIRIKYNRAEDEYVIQTFWIAGGWWKVITGKEACADLFRLCENYNSN